MRTFCGFKPFLEEILPNSPYQRQPFISTFDFDETLTKWEQYSGKWRQVPNTENIKTYVYPQFKRGQHLYIVTFRDPALADDPRFQLYEKIEDYIEEWGMSDVIKGVVYTKLRPKGDYIFNLCENRSLPFLHHYDDEAFNCKNVNDHPGLREIAAKPEYQLATHLPYKGPRPPKN